MKLVLIQVREEGEMERAKEQYNGWGLGFGMNGGRAVII
jgi:hypothetical protein